jgi:2-polyprenyl-3-methyl-5-hydroxy-6-metoxy-1,4-benzoquinol methylase
MSNTADFTRVKDDALSAELYNVRKQSKHDDEMQMIANAVESIPAASVTSFLDAPCGVGRATIWLSHRGFEVHAIDLGKAAVELTRKKLAAERIDAIVDNQDIFNLSYEDKSFDSTLCFRLLHHFGQSDLQDALVEELCRVSNQYVVISYISPYSVTSLRRKIRRFFTGKAIKQNPTHLDELEKRFDQCEFQLHHRVQRSGFLHSLQLAVFKRIEQG